MNILGSFISLTIKTEGDELPYRAVYRWREDDKELFGVGGQIESALDYLVNQYNEHKGKVDKQWEEYRQ